MIWYLDSAPKQLESTLFQKFICSYTPETNFQVTLEQWENDGSYNNNTYCFMFDNLPLNQKQKWFEHQLESTLFQ